MSRNRVKLLLILKTLAVVFILVAISVTSIEGKDKNRKGKVKTPLTAEITQEIIYVTLPIKWLELEP